MNGRPAPSPEAVARALAPARAEVLWTDRPDAPAGRAALRGSIDADLVVIGGGFTGLWAAMHATAETGRRVVVLEAERIGHGASSRNGGFCDVSLTHGLMNGLAHWPDEIDTLIRLGEENHGELLQTLDDEGIDACAERVGWLGVATADWQLAELRDVAETEAAYGGRAELLDAAATQARLDSPTFVGGIMQPGLALIDPARLVWGLAEVAERRGVQLYDGSPALAVGYDGHHLRVRTPDGEIRAERVVTATNAYPAPVRRPRRYVIPVYDYVLATEPLTTAQLASLGWAGREGVSDSGNQFHYYRLTDDNRILWGGYDAVYHFGKKMGSALDQRQASHELLAEHFLATFPQLEGVTFSHRWGGAIGTTTRFTAAWGTAHDGRLAWVAGYTGLGVAASRFGARVALDLVDGLQTERTELSMVRRRPFPFPPEPFRWVGVQLTRRAIARADRRGGRRGPWLALLDRFGIGFDS